MALLDLADVILALDEDVRLDLLQRIQRVIAQDDLIDAVNRAHYGSALPVLEDGTAWAFIDEGIPSHGYH